MSERLHGPTRWLTRGVAILLIVGAAATVVHGIAAARTHTVNVVFSDRWSIIFRYEELLDGRRGLFDYIFQRHSDHPHATAYAVGLLDLVWFRGRGNLEIACQLAASLLTLALLLGVLYGWRRHSPLDNLLMGLVYTLAIFNLRPLEAWIFPFQFILPQARLFVLLTLTLGVAAGRRTLPALAAASCALIASFSHGSGSFVLGLLLALFALRRHLRGCLATLAAAAIFLSVNNLLSRTPDGSLAWNNSIDALIHHPAHIGKFACVFLGAPLARETTTALYLGAIGVVATLSLLVLAWRQQLTEPSKFLVVQACLLAYTVGSALAAGLLHTAVDGSGPGADLGRAASSRYCIVSLLFWCALLAAAVHTAWTFRSATLTWVCRATLSAAAVVLVLRSVEAESAIATWGYLLRDAQSSLAARVFDREAAQRLYQPIPFDDAESLKHFEFLQRRHLSTFSSVESLLPGMVLDASYAVPHRMGRVAALQPIDYGPGLVSTIFERGLRVYGVVDRKAARDLRCVVFVDDRNLVVGVGNVSQRLAPVGPENPVWSAYHEAPRGANVWFFGYVTDRGRTSPSLRVVVVRHRDHVEQMFHAPSAG
jgi:hypothetical protein